MKNGKITVTVHGGACKVMINGQARGPAPIYNAPIPSGEHRVTCIPSKGAIATRVVSVRPNETTRVQLTLPSGGKKR